LKSKSGNTPQPSDTNHEYGHGYFCCLSPHVFLISVFIFQLSLLWLEFWPSDHLESAKFKFSEPRIEASNQDRSAPGGT
jgi:hypothetical protein